MVNKLRVLAPACGLALGTLAAWAALNYGTTSPARFLPYLVAGAVVASLPWLLAHGKLLYRRLRYRYRDYVDHPSAGTVFATPGPVDDPQRILDSLAQAETLSADFTDVERADLEQGSGLRVSHTAFHESYVQFTDDDRLVITGPAAGKNREVAEHVEDVCEITVRQSKENPLWGTIPVRGAPRFLLGLCVVVAAVLGTMGVAGAAYPSSAYNPVEKTILVSFDARGDLDPRVSWTEANLGKASFMVDVLAEKRVEMKWELNDTSAIRRHRREAAAIVQDTEQLLSRIRERTSDPASQARADEIEARLVRVERRVERTAARQLAQARNATATPTAEPPFEVGAALTDRSAGVGTSAELPPGW